MALTKAQIHGLNRINAAAQKAGLGNLLAKIEKIAIEAEEGPELDSIRKELDLIREELGEMLEMIVGLEELKEKIKINDQAISAIGKSLSKFESQLNKFIKIQKKSKPNSTQ